MLADQRVAHRRCFVATGTVCFSSCFEEKGPITSLRSGEIRFLISHVFKTLTISRFDDLGRNGGFARPTFVGTTGVASLSLSSSSLLPLHLHGIPTSQVVE